MSYSIKLEIFEGPLDLLLYLIKKDELDIYDIPISRVTGQYFEYIRLMGILDLDIAGEFLVMAATLMHIKSKMLLPEDELAEEEDEEEDSREALIQQLLEYKRYKDAASVLEQKECLQKNVFMRPAGEGKDEVLLDVNLFDLLSAFSGVLERFKKEEEPAREIERDEITVGEKIRLITDILMKEKSVNFARIFAGVRSRVEAVVTFLALLELIRLQEVMVREKTEFGEVYIQRKTGVKEQELEASIKE